MSDDLADELLERLQWAHSTTYALDMSRLFREVLASDSPIEHLRYLTVASPVALRTEWKAPADPSDLETRCNDAIRGIDRDIYVSGDLVGLIKECRDALAAHAAEVARLERVVGVARDLIGRAQQNMGPYAEWQADARSWLASNPIARQEQQR